MTWLHFPPISSLVLGFPMAVFDSFRFPLRNVASLNPPFTMSPRSVASLNPPFSTSSIPPSQRRLAESPSQRRACTYRSASALTTTTFRPAPMLRRARTHLSAITAMTLRPAPMLWRTRTHLSAHRQQTHRSSMDLTPSDE